METNHLAVGILAHVDAGKTTLAEGILYHTGSIRKVGRVDHQDAFLDTYALEKERGITIFSKQAGFTLNKKKVVLLDTPGHVDFSAEMERTLQVLDYAILVISGADGVQGHVQTLWKLLKEYEIPVFLFVNKMDQEGTDRENLLLELQSRLDKACVDFTFSKENNSEFLEELAVCDDEVLEKYLEQGEVPTSDIQKMIRRRQVFPCYFGSALKLQGIQEFLEGLDIYTKCPQYGDTFGAKVFKISRDEKGNRLTHLKVTGGSLKVKQIIKGRDWEEKATVISILENKKLVFQRVTPYGYGATITMVIDHPVLGIDDEEKALDFLLEHNVIYNRPTIPEMGNQEEMKRQQALAEEAYEDLAESLRYHLRIANTAIEYYQNQVKQEFVGNVYLVGDGSRFAGMHKLFAQELPLPLQEIDFTKVIDLRSGKNKAAEGTVTPDAASSGTRPKAATAVGFLSVIGAAVHPIDARPKDMLVADSKKNDLHTAYVILAGAVLVSVLLILGSGVRQLLAYREHRNLTKRINDLSYVQETYDNRTENEQQPLVGI